MLPLIRLSVLQSLAMCPYGQVREPPLLFAFGDIQGTWRLPNNFDS